MFFERVETGDGDCACGGEAFAGEETEKGGFAGAVCADEEGARGGGKGEEDVVEAGGVVGEGEC